MSDEPDQALIDRATAMRLGISLAHAILLRQADDRAADAPTGQPTRSPEIVGDQTQAVFAFWRHLDRMDEVDWRHLVHSATQVGWAEWRYSRKLHAEAVATPTKLFAAQAATRSAFPDEPGDIACLAVAEIMGGAALRNRGLPFLALPLFGFTDPDAVRAADRGDA